MIEVIVRYNGNIERVAEEENAEVEILNANYGIITIDESRVNELRLYPEIEYIEFPRILQLSVVNAKRESCIDRVKSPNFYNLSGKGVLIAIIDSGIDYVNNDFRNDDGSTRILSIWNQTINGTPPKGFNYGSEFTESQINEALNSSNPYSLDVDDYLRHGTNVTRIACGSKNGVASNCQIIVVKLGEKGRESFARTTEIMRAIKYVMDKAIELNMPICINISYGTNDGAHNGNLLFENYINDMATIHKCSICVASGNEGANGHHFSENLLNGQQSICEFIIGSDIRNVFLTLWKNFNDDVSYELIAPNGRSSGKFYSYDGAFSFNTGDATVNVTFTQPTSYNILEEVYFNININSSSGVDELWKIFIYGENIVDGKINLWLPVTERVTSRTKFLRPDVNTSLTIPSTTQRVITVGAYNSNLNSIADFSGRGFTADNRIKPDLVAPGVNIITGGTGFENLEGTSFATPFVTGSCALLMEWGIVQGNDLFLYGERLKAFLQKGCNRKSNLKYPNQSWGWGSLCLENSLRLLELYKNF